MTNEHLVHYKQIDSINWLLFFKFFDDEIAVKIPNPTFNESAGDLILYSQAGYACNEAIQLDDEAKQLVKAKQEWVSFQNPDTVKVDKGKRNRYVAPNGRNYYLFENDIRSKNPNLRLYSSLTEQERIESKKKHAIIVAYEKEKQLKVKQARDAMNLEKKKQREKEGFTKRRRKYPEGYKTSKGYTVSEAVKERSRKMIGSIFMTDGNIVKRVAKDEIDEWTAKGFVKGTTTLKDFSEATDV